MIEEPHFKEGQSFAGFVDLALALGIGAVLLPPRHWPLTAMVLAVLVCAANLLYMTTAVDGRAIRIRFGLILPFYIRTINVSEIESVEAVSYSPIAEYGGWGIRGTGARVALNARGNRGVLLRLTGRRTVLIGSQRPEELANAIGQAIR